MRHVLVLVALLLVAAPSADAAPRPLTRLSANEGFALVGDRVLFSQSTEHRVQMRVMPVAGGPPGTIASLPITSKVRSVRLVAAGDRAGALVSLTHKDGRIGTQLFAGGLDGGWAAVTQVAHAWDGRSMPVSLQLDSGLTFTLESRKDSSDITAVVRDPAPRDLPYHTRSARFAGDLVAYVTTAPDQTPDQDGRRVVVANWRTAAELGATELPHPVADLALAADGRVVAADEAGGAYTFTPGQPARWLGTASDGRVGFAGEHVAVADRGRLWLAPPGGPLRPFGVLTRRLTGFTADPQHVVWHANGCLLITALGDAAVGEPGPGPCDRSEVELTGVAGTERRPKFTLRCVASPRGGCRGMLQLYADRRRVGPTVAFRVPARARRTVTFTLSNRTVARLRAADAIGVDTGAGPEYPGAS